MTSDHRDLITIVGFLAAYAGVMGALLLWSVPLFEPIHRQATLYGALPCFLVGTCLVLYSHFGSTSD